MTITHQQENKLSFLCLMNPFRAFKSLKAQKDPLIQIIQRKIQVEYKGNYLGILWLILDPIFLMAIYSIVFGHFLGARFFTNNNPSGTEYALALFLGIILFNLISETLNNTPKEITSVPNYVKKVRFPVEILPLGSVITSLWKLSIGIIVLLFGMLLTHSSFHLNNLLLPVIILPLTLFSAGIAWLLSALGVFFRDIGKLMRFVSIITLYGSAIFFPPDLIAEKSQTLWSIMQWNPVLLTIDMSRKVMLWNQGIQLDMLIYLYLLSCFTFLIGYTVFSKLKPAFSDVL